MEEGSHAGVQVHGEKHRILIVDDELEIAKALARLFRRQGYEVTLATSAAEALGLLEQVEPHLVLSDFRMPGQDGIYLLGEVKRRAPGARRVLFSGYVGASPAEADLVADAVFAKPWDAKALLAAVADLLGSR